MDVYEHFEQNPGPKSGNIFGEFFKFISLTNLLRIFLIIKLH